MVLGKKLGWLGVDHLEVGMYDEASKKGLSFSCWLEMQKALKEETPYAGLTQAEIYWKKKELMRIHGKRPNTAFEDCFAAADIRAFGQVTDSFGKLYAYSDSATLVPEFISTRVYAAMLAESLVPQLIANDEVIRGSDFRKVYLDDVEGERMTTITGKGDELRTTKISVSSQASRMKKYGRFLELAYEDYENVTLNLFGLALDRIGRQIWIDETDDCITCAVSGDGNSNSASTYNPTTTAVLVTKDIITLATKLATPYKANVLIGRKTQLIDYYAVLADFDNPVGTFGFMGIDLPKVYEWDRSALTSDYLLILDTRFALGRISSGAVLTEAENIIRRQIKGTAVSIRSGFHKIDNNATYVLDVTT